MATAVTALAGALPFNPVAWPEPFGMVMAEALACGVVATPFGSVPELVRDGVTGFVRHGVGGPGDALAGVDGLDRHRCRLDAIERFSTARTVAEHPVLYQRLLAGRDIAA